MLNKYSPESNSSFEVDNEEKIKSRKILKRKRTVKAEAKQQTIAPAIQNHD